MDRRRVGLTLGAATVALLAACQVSVGGRAAGTPQGTPPTNGAATPAATPEATPATAVPTPKPKAGLSRSSFGNRPNARIPMTRPGSSSGGTTPPPSNLPPVQNADNIFGSATGDADSFLGSIYFLTGNPTNIPDLTPLTPSGTMFTKSLGVAPQTFEGNFPGVGTRPEWFALRYEGPLTVAKEADYQLRLVSDDGAKLSIDDMVILNNDGILDAPKEAKSPVHLLAGTHAIRIDYLKGAGKNVALQVFVSGGSLSAEKALTTNL